MKIDIGADGKILGTKRVSPNGQVSGFTEYAGLDVLVILPGGRSPVVRRDTQDLVREAEALVRQQMELAFEKYKELRAKYPNPDAATKQFLKQLRGVRMPGLVARADAWVRQQLGANGPARGARRSAGRRRRRE